MKAPSTAGQIADTIICLARERKIQDVTNLKLQKLVYYAQAWHLAIQATPLFDDEIEAWVHGPVVPSLFRRFRSYRWNPIDCQVQPVASLDTRQFIGKVLKAYGGFTANDLERLTHQEAPWREARRGLPPDASCHNAISKESMRGF